ncbi:MAG: DUF3696 domain-containing protein [Clostridia bacterium]|nr:DUF3696 domain-containing protein [Clostridia bacterium]MDD4387112.1 DUF3696 domain-containing protein [Clostridia bacterium]
MIKKINIQGLKSIANIDIDCSKLNFIVGVNSSGKSSALQALLLLAQNTEKESGLNGPLISFARYRDVRNYNITLPKISISASNESGKIKIMIEEQDENIVTEVTGENKQLLEKLRYKNKHVHYISCQRIGSQDTYLKNLSNDDSIGANGEYALYYLSKHKGDTLDNSLIKSSGKYTLDYQVDYWLKYIINATVSTEDIVGTNVLKAYFSIIDGKPTIPKNVGSGISYIVSIIIMCLASKEGDILIIENPEIHLHPSAQAKICDFLYFIAKSGRQLFVETHSDHLFNGIRAGIATESMNGQDISVNFFSLDKNNCTKNTKIQFGKRGRILNHEDGLFDQFDADLDRILGI